MLTLFYKYFKLFASVCLVWLFSFSAAMQRNGGGGALGKRNVSQLYTVYLQASERLITQSIRQ